MDPSPEDLWDGSTDLIFWRQYGAQFAIGEGLLVSYGDINSSVEPFFDDQNALPFIPTSLSFSIRVKLTLDWAIFLDNEADLAEEERKLIEALSAALGVDYGVLSHHNGTHNPIILHVQKTPLNDISLQRIEREVHLLLSRSSIEYTCDILYGLAFGVPQPLINFISSQLTGLRKHGRCRIEMMHEPEIEKDMFQVTCDSTTVALAVLKEVQEITAGLIITAPGSSDAFWDAALEMPCAFDIIRQSITRTLSEEYGMSLETHPMILIDLLNQCLRAFGPAETVIDPETLFNLVKNSLPTIYSFHHQDMVAHFRGAPSTYNPSEPTSRNLLLILCHCYNRYVLRCDESRWSRILQSTPQETVCCVDQTNQDGILPLPCGHYICFECLQNQLQSVTATINSVSCISCGYLPTPLEIRWLLIAYADYGTSASYLFEFHLRARVLNHIARHPSRMRHCFNCRSLWFPAPRGRQEQEYFTCRTCLTSFCNGCGERHDPLTSDCTEEPTIQEIDGIRFIVCNGYDGACGARIERDGGCDHMICPTCGNHLCWQCGMGFGNTEGALADFYQHVDELHDGDYGAAAPAHPLAVIENEDAEDEDEDAADANNDAADEDQGAANEDEDVLERDNDTMDEDDNAVHEDDDVEMTDTQDDEG